MVDDREGCFQLLRCHRFACTHHKVRDRVDHELWFIELNVVAGFTRNDVLAVRGNLDQLALQLLMHRFDRDLQYFKSLGSSTAFEPRMPASNRSP